ncbi:MAG TPA: hypothetical protein VGU25_17830 [Acidobacteriaceae bacterium]|nr:hypothetical protein [Acidobacteriaceae bacterium]
MPRSSTGFARAWPATLLPLLALIVVGPLMAHGVSCGHDFEFHLQSWLDAAAQMRHGTLDPAWTISAAWNAGEPRFLFYPPISWMFGALLALMMPLSAVPIVFTAVALVGAGVTMYLLARDYASGGVALLAAAVYIGNPYMLFTAFERTAYGELLAAVWIPLLIRAALRAEPGIPGIAIPTALLWLTNAPAAVIGIYTLLLIGLLRIGFALFPTARRSRAIAQMLVVRFSAGGLLGLAVAAFYLLPAAYERRYVQVAMAIIANMRVDDNFLFGHTGDGPHDGVLHTASLIALSMLIVAGVALATAFFLRKRDGKHGRLPDSRSDALPILAALTLFIALLLTPVSLPIWHHVPELAFLQFPWRFLCVLGATLALTIALAFRSIPNLKTSNLLLPIVAVAFVGTMTGREIITFRQPCEALDLPFARAQLFTTHHGVEPTDEYTPGNADNDVLRWDDPGYWLAATASAFAPGTVPNPAATIINYDLPPPVDQTISGVAPRHLQLTLSQPEVLVLNLRDFPAWQVFRNGTLLMTHLQRDDGLLAIALPAGSSSIDVRWHRTWDDWLGDAITILALGILGALLVRSRTIKRDA